MTYSEYLEAKGQLCLWRLVWDGKRFLTVAAWEEEDVR
jgi:hypothetical protein